MYIESRCGSGNPLLTFCPCAKSFVCGSLPLFYFEIIFATSESRRVRATTSKSMREKVGG